MALESRMLSNSPCGVLIGGACGGDAALARDAVARDPTAKRLVPEDARQPKTRGRGIGHLYELSRVLA